jgi:hypothetical protein
VPASYPAIEVEMSLFQSFMPSIGTPKDENMAIFRAILFELALNIELKILLKLEG